MRNITLEIYFMNTILSTKLGKFRIIALLEGISLLVLLLICMPLKYFYNLPEYTKLVGSIHGALFILYIIYAWILSEEYNWEFKKTTWKVVLASFIPFGTFYIDKNLLSKYK